MFKPKVIPDKKRANPRTTKYNNFKNHFATHILGLDEPEVRHTDGTGSASPFWRAIARAILDGEVPSNLQSDFPVVRGLVEQFTSARESGDLDPQFDPRLVSAATVALALGWLLFEPFLLPAANLDDVEPEQLRGELHVFMLGVLHRLAPAPTNQGNTE